MNKLINVAALGAVATSSVYYLGGEVDVPESHSWVGIVKANVAGVSTYIMASFRDKPQISANGNLILQEGNEMHLLEQVGLMPIGESTLRKVRGHSAVDILEQNTEELMFKAAHILEDASATTEEKLHALFCPSHGVVVDFLRHQVPTAETVLEEQAAKQVEPQETSQVDAREELPPEVKHLLNHFEAQGVKVHVERVA